MNSIVEQTWQSIQLLANSFIVHAQVDESCRHFALLYACEIFSVIPVKTLRLQGRLTTPSELFTGKKPKIGNLRVLFCPVIVKKHTITISDRKEKDAVIGTTNIKAVAQQGYRGMFIGLDETTSGYLIFVPSTRQIVTSVDVIFDEYFLASLVHKYRTYREALTSRPVQDVPLEATDKTGDIMSMHPFPVIPETTIRHQDNKGGEDKSEEFLSDANVDSDYDFDDNFVFAVENDNEVNGRNKNTSNDSDSIQSRESNENTSLDDDGDINSNESNEINNIDENEEIKEYEVYEPPVTRSHRTRNRRIKGNEWVNLVREIKSEVEPWSTYGDPTMYLPEPKGVKAIIRLEK